MINYRHSNSPTWSKRLSMPPLALWLTIADGRITCRRCTARSKRSQEQCRRPALRTSRTAKCQFHGGASTGPRTPEGRASIAEVHRRHGLETRLVRIARSEASAKLRALDDIARLVGLMHGSRPTGRKPLGYTPIQTLEQAMAYRDSHPVHPVSPGVKVPRD
jgi:hypothetical protein